MKNKNESSLKEIGAALNAKTHWVLITDWPVKHPRVALFVFGMTLARHFRQIIIERTEVQLIFRKDTTANRCVKVGPINVILIPKAEVPREHLQQGLHLLQFSQVLEHDEQDIVCMVADRNQIDDLVAFIDFIRASDLTAEDDYEIMN